MTLTESLPNLLRRTSELRNGKLVNRFANGLAICTDVPESDDPLRVLSLGRPQDAVLNYMVNCPTLVRGKRVFEPFAGAGAFGFMALHCGARHVDFLDISPRSLAFQRENALLNEVRSDRFRAIEGSITTFRPDEKYDVILANPPFVPTPDGVRGTLTSNGGPEGNRFVQVLLAGLEETLQPDGTVLLYVFQFVSDGRPLIIDLLQSTLQGKRVELTPAQDRPIPFDDYISGYLRTHPDAEQPILGWQSQLMAVHGKKLTLSHFIVHIRPDPSGATTCTIKEDFAQRYGEDFLILSEDPDFIPIDGRRR